MSDFRAFPEATFEFLRQLARHNDRDWFTSHKKRYEQDVAGQGLAFIEAMAPRLESISPHFTAIPRKIGGSMMRPYRDVRFSADKRPYKTNLGIQFRHELGRDVHAPGFYVHVEPDAVFLGVGLWRPAADALKAIRQGILDDPKRWAAARDAKSFARRFALAGDSLKTAPRGIDKDHPQIEDLRRTDFIATRELDEGEMCRAGLPDRIARDFAAATPFARWLCAALGVPF